MGPSHAAQAAPTSAEQICAQINNGYFSNTPATISDSLAALDAQKAAIDPGTFAYVRAYGLFRIASLPHQKDSVAQFLEADRLLGSNLTQVPEAEIYALRALIDCYLAGAGQLDLAIQYGSVCIEEADHALRLEPKNVRALLALADAKGNTPPEYGGDRHAAIARLNDAARTFATPAPTGIFSWGEADVYTSLGIFQLKEKNRAAARTAFAAALQARPDFSWVKNILLPKTVPKTDHS